MGLFSIDKNPKYIEMENKINMITKVITKYNNFMSATEQIILIKQILNNTVKKI